VDTSDSLVVAYQCQGTNVGEMGVLRAGNGNETGGVPFISYNITPSQSNKDYNARASERSQAITGNGNRPSARGGDVIAFNARQYPTHGPVADPIGTKDTGHGFVRGSAVRRLTPRECERLQGFPDDYTLIQHRGKPAADGPRYKALGNSMAVPVMRWIGERIQLVEALQARSAA
jgi:DNA (cytosine-5)-methyltransferase 1